MTAPLSFVVITGLSGAGKSFAIKCFEDMGFFCVDNLPTTLIPTFADLITRSEQPIHRVALGVDVREGAYLSSLLDTIQELKSRGHAVEVLFLEATEESLVRRYHESRRRHPLAGDGNALDGIRAERKALSNLREVADRILDTTALTVHQLKDRLVEQYVVPKARAGLAPTLVSFGFKHGVPFDADLVFDVRFLPNPHFVEALRPLDGRDSRVRDFVMKAEESRELLRRLEDFLGFVLPAYQREGKAYLTVAVGCTGGRHRSVALVEELKGFLDRLGLAAGVVHRDLDRE
jgi:UPF0042 nucleotide-binding protein